MGGKNIWERTCQIQKEASIIPKLGEEPYLCFQHMEKQSQGLLASHFFELARLKCGYLEKRQVEFKCCY